MKQLVKVDLPVEKVSEMLTDCGLEVEGVEKFESIKGGLQGFVIGKVVSKDKHPDADKLSITKVDVGQGQLLDIVCGAPNVAEGQKVVVATIGTMIYSEKGNIISAFLACVGIVSISSQLWKYFLICGKI